VTQPDVYVVRHGATEWSVSGQHTGRTDIPLTDDGREQARGVARLLVGREFAHVFVSPMARARETCEIVGLAEQAEVTDDLCEWDYGDYEGLTSAHIRERAPGWTVWTGEIPSGESIDEVAARADRVIARACSFDGDVALFGHGHILRMITARWCELAPVEGRRFVLDTATLNVLGWEHGSRGIHLWNDR
jgi:broad specificity phosphatase PhoE